jgi:hypothetical protein
LTPASPGAVIERYNAVTAEIDRSLDRLEAEKKAVLAVVAASTMVPQIRFRPGRPPLRQARPKLPRDRPARRPHEPRWLLVNANDSLMKEKST